MDSSHPLCTTIDFALAGLFTAWFLISVAAQLRDDVQARMPALSGAGLIPRWAFFAPRPATHDTHLMYRDRDSFGTIGELVPVTSPESRRWFHAVWNPNKFHTKVVDDLMAAMAVQKRDIEHNDFAEQSLMLTVPYIALLHIVMHARRPETSVARQFVIINDQPFSPHRHPEVGFVSKFHAFSRVDEPCT